jgi:hypothetical protein
VRGEPVAWIDPIDFESLSNDGWCVVHAQACDPGASHAASMPLYTAPPAPLTLTDDLVRKAVIETGLADCIDDAYYERGDWLPLVRAFARAVLAAAQEKQT